MTYKQWFWLTENFISRQKSMLIWLVSETKKKKKAEMHITGKASMASCHVIPKYFVPAEFLAGILD